MNIIDQCSIFATTNFQFGLFHLISIPPLSRISGILQGTSIKVVLLYIPKFACSDEVEFIYCVMHASLSLNSAQMFTNVDQNVIVLGLLTLQRWKYEKAHLYFINTQFRRRFRYAGTRALPLKLMLFTTGLFQAAHV